MRKTVTRVRTVCYLLLTEMIAVYLIAFPVHAFQVSSSTTGYVRVASQAAVASMVAAQRAATLSSVAALVSTSTAGSIGVRLVAGARDCGGGHAGDALLRCDEKGANQSRSDTACPVVDPRVYQYLYRRHHDVCGDGSGMASI